MLINLMIILLAKVLIINTIRKLILCITVLTLFILKTERYFSFFCKKKYKRQNQITYIQRYLIY